LLQNRGSVQREPQLHLGCDMCCLVRATAWWYLGMGQRWNGDFSPMTQQHLAGQGLLIIGASRSHSNTPYSVGLLWTNDQPDAETSTLQHTTQQRHPCPRRDSNSQYQQASGRRPTPYTSTPHASAEWRWSIGEPKKLTNLQQCQSLCSYTYLHKITRQSAVRSQRLAP